MKIAESWCGCEEQAWGSPAEIPSAAGQACISKCGKRDCRADNMGDFGFTHHFLPPERVLPISNAGSNTRASVLHCRPLTASAGIPRTFPVGVQ